MLTAILCCCWARVGQALPTSTQMAERARKALQAEQRKVQSLQASLTAGMRQQQELQAVMRQCMEDAREDRQACGGPRRHWAGCMN